VTENIQPGSRLARSILLLGVATLALLSPAQAQMVCQINLEITERARASGGQGTLTCDGQSHAVRADGVGGGGVIGMARVTLEGEVRNLRQVSDIEGTYSGEGGSLSFGDRFSNVIAVNGQGVQLVFTPGGVQGGDSLNVDALQISLE